jgi:hypothetical protein
MLQILIEGFRDQEIRIAGYFLALTMEVLVLLVKKMGHVRVK